MLKMTSVRFSALGLAVLMSLTACSSVSQIAKEHKRNLPMPVEPLQAQTMPTGADAFAPEQGTGLTQQQQVHAKKYMVASANPLATEAGYDILKQGGSAVDAMIAVQSTLSLVEPQSSGLGGGAFVVYWDNKTKTLTTFDGRETAPLKADGKLFLDEQGKPLKFILHQMC